MARPAKEGLDYFPFDVDFDTNDKTEAIMGEFGSKGVLIFIFLLSAIYRKGYYLQWNELVKNQLANRVAGATGDLVQRVLDRLIAYGTFSRELFNSAEVLTSQRIQDTYEVASKRRKQPKSRPYWINVDNNSVNEGFMYAETPQSKVNESKVNKTKDRQSVAGEADAFSRWQKVWGFPNAVASEDLTRWIDQFGDDLVCWSIDYAARRAIQARAADKYLDRMMERFEQTGIKTVAEAEAEAEQHAKTARANAPRPQQSYGKPRRQEAIPVWMQEGYKPPEPKEPSDEDKAILAQNLADLEKLRQEHNRGKKQ